MINILCTKDADELKKIHSLLREYFKSYEVVSYRDFVYYAQNFASLYEREDYIVYKIETAAKLIGMLSCVKLNEFVLIDYLVIDVEHRCYSKEIMRQFNVILRDFRRPIIVEAESEELCRLYRMFGFKKFNEPYKYITLRVSPDNKTSEISAYDSNLLYLSADEMNFEATKRIIYEKYYKRWNSKYGEELTKEYNKTLEL